MDTVAKEIKRLIPKNENETCYLKDALTVKRKSSDQRWSIRSATFKEQSAPQTRFPFAEEQEESPKSSNETQKANGSQAAHNNTNAKGDFRRSGNNLPIQGIPIPTGKRSCRIYLKTQEECNAGELRLTIDEGLDECDDPKPVAFLELKNVRMDGKEIASGNLLKDHNGHALGLRLGKLDKNQEILIETEYNIPDKPDSVKIADDAPIVLKAHVVRRSSV